ALVEETGVDLRDPKLSIMPDGRLMIVAGGSIFCGTTELKGRQPRGTVSSGGRPWGGAKKGLAQGGRVWRVTRRGGKAYGVAYTAPAPPAERTVTLYTSTDGVAWDLITPLKVTDKPGETTVRFDKSGTLLALVRREKNGWLGTAKPPFKEWTWKE